MGSEHSILQLRSLALFQRAQLEPLGVRGEGAAHGEEKVWVKPTNMPAGHRDPKGERGRLKKKKKA